ncbi:Nadph:adrenodoxin oxidoreductase, partial [Globisporangium splendens]
MMAPWLRRSMTPARRSILRSTSAQWTATSAFSSTVSDVTDTALRVCIVGSGPAGFYAAKYLLKEHDGVRVDMLEALPAPYGLVRSGVAPDHPEVKSVMNDFEKVAAEARFDFLGNVRVGDDITLSELKQHYHAVVLAYGAAGDRELGIPGEHLAGVLSARAFVNWYNGHPQFRDLPVDLSGETAVIFGQGNVAVDCARILTKSVDELATTDISQHAVDVLRNSNIKKVYLIGRRGSAQAAFTMKEIRELTKLTNVSCVVDPDDMKASLNESSQQEINEQRAKKRMNELLTKVSSEFGKEDAGARQVQIKFLSAPVELLADRENPEKVGSVRVEKTELQGEANRQRAVGTGEFETITASLVLRSIGYKSQPLEDAPFDTKRNVLANDQGRLVDVKGDGEQVVGLYCSGWVKRGPSGIIGTNIVDARETVTSIVEDIASGKILNPASSNGLETIKQIILGRNPEKQLVSWKDYERLNDEETKRGEAVGKPREKFTSVEEMLRIVAEK